MNLLSRALCLFALLGLPTAEAGGAAALQRFVDEVRTLSARFEQVQADESGAVLSRQSGHFELLRPGRFRWSYDAPYEQLMICDGQRIWNYEPDLQQATVRDAAAVLDGTPAALLAQGGAALVRSFAVESLGRDADGERLRLRPRTDDADFREIELWLVEGVPQRLRFVDALGGSSDIRFSALRSGLAIPVARFVFTPPAGVEVIDAGAAP